MSDIRGPKNVKRAQRQSYILHTLTPSLIELFSDEPLLAGLFVTRVELSQDRSMCTVFFSTFTSKETYDAARETLKLYKPSVRHALSQILHSRYTPHIRFRYDEGKEKERHLDKIFEKIKDEN